MMKAGREAVVGGRYGGVVAYAVGGSFLFFVFGVVGWLGTVWCFCFVSF